MNEQEGKNTVGRNMMCKDRTYRNKQEVGKDRVGYENEVGKDEVEENRLKGIKGGNEKLYKHPVLDRCLPLG